MTLPASGTISLGDIAGEFGGTAPHSVSEYYRGGSLVESTYKNITYTQLYGYNGSPNIGTKYPNSTSFSYPWHNRTFSGDQSSWRTSMVRETDEVVAYCLMNNVYVTQMGWRWTAGTSGYTQNPYYFKMQVVGSHATSSGGTTLTGTTYYTGTITRSDQSQGDASFSRRSGDPGSPNSTSVNNGSTSEVESGVNYLYDMSNCTVEIYFNSFQPGTSSASFSFNWGSGLSVNAGVPASGTSALSDFYSAENY
jgi:hypothetical protein